MPRSARGVAHLGTIGTVHPSPRPCIVVTLGDPRRSHHEANARRKNDLYLDAVRRGGGDPIPLDETCGIDERTTALGVMDGLLLSGGTDLDPALYGSAPDRSVGIQRRRDALELAAWEMAGARGLPVLGICRGLQAVNVFMGGRLVQHLDGHESPSYLEGPPVTHPLRLVPGSRIERILIPGGAEGSHGAQRAGRREWSVNTYHHQGVRPVDVAPGLAPVGFAPYGAAELVEALEAMDGQWVIGVQFHPERTESTPPEFERLFAALADAARLGR